MSSPLESCAAAEAKIRNVQKLLLEPGKLDSCRAELGEVIGTLEPLTAGKRQWSPEEKSSFRRIQQAVRTLKAQIDHAANMWQGLLQLRTGAGYTEQGQPYFFEPPSRSFEG